MFFFKYVLILTNSEGIAPSPPPLPPRTRTNTNQGNEFTRSYTNPETETFKKRSYNLFDFLRHKRTGSCNGNPESEPADVQQYQQQQMSTPTTTDHPASASHSKVFELTAASKRSSFSSPDLTKIEPYGSSDGDDDEPELLHTGNIDDLNVTSGRFETSNDLFLTCSRTSSPEPMQVGSTNYSSGCSTTASQRTSASSLPSDETSPPQFNGSPPSSPLGIVRRARTADMNISQSIQPSYNTSCNDMSTVNLVGADVGDHSAQLEQVGVTLVDCSSGYCAMAPIFRTVKIKQPLSPFSASELTKSITCRRGEDERLSRAIKQLLLTDTADDGRDDVDGMAKPSKVPEVRRELKKELAFAIEPTEVIEHIPTPNDGVYSNIDLLPIDPPDGPAAPSTTAATTPAPPPKRHKAKSLLLCSQSPSANSSSDEKYPSYFPNTSVRPTPSSLPRRQSTSPHPQPVLGRSHHHHTPRSENVFISTPHSKITRKSPPSKTAHKSRAVVNLRNITATRGDSDNQLVIPATPAACVSPSKTEPAAAEENPTPQRRYAKYSATMSRLSPNRYAAAASAVAGAPLRASATEPVAVLQNANSAEKQQPPPQQPTIKSTANTANLGSSIKRFASLPRFRKIDFSPLKMRINNVLQRTNSENF